MKRIARVPAVLLTVISVLLLATCDLLVPVDWSDYVDVNLIATTPLAVATPPTWRADWDAPYILFESVPQAEIDAHALEAGLPDDAGPIHRLEILNLMPNGTFDAGTAPWYAVGPAGIITHDPAGFMDIDFDERENRVEFAISDLLDAALANEAETRPVYLFRTMMNSVTAAIRLEYYDGETVNGDEVAPDGWRFDTPLAGDWELFPDAFDPVDLSVPATVFAARTGAGVFSIGTRGDDPPVQTMAIDDFRVIRSDLPLGLRLAVPYIEPDRPELPRGGTYTFRVWARIDPTAGTANRIGARSLSATITTRVGERSFPIGASSWEVNEITDDWVEYVATFTGISFTRPVDTTEAPIEIVITPTNAGAELQDLDAGSLLISSPSLEWSPR
ncbi:MAG: hypothetical protein EA426_06950 [Spirochaetaceae bacterium]|nr:MAG: hypothetical protein EA426_06950 [Spirochaetaceae bacterium]